jgi:endonuclease/exonuclease/phosphatase family metal-dependent hydrolase
MPSLPASAFRPALRVPATFSTPAARRVRLALALAMLMITAGCGQDGRARFLPGGEGGEGGVASSGSSATGTGGQGGSGGSGGSGPAKDPLPLKVMNWNTHNFFNDKDDSAAPQETIVTTAEYQSHLKAVGKVVAAINPDIAVMQEVENTAVLDDLVKTQLGGAYPSIGLIPANDPRGINIGVIAKIPIVKLVSHKDDVFTQNGTIGPTYTYARDCVEIHVEHNGRKLVFLGVHFRAKVQDDPAKRLAEAQHTRKIADALAAADPARGIAVLGDFNDTPGSPPYLAVLGADAGQYTDAPGLLPQNDAWSTSYNGTLELIDHQMSDPFFAKMLDASTVGIRHGADVNAASDHDPVFATYQVR